MSGNIIRREQIKITQSGKLEIIEKFRMVYMIDTLYLTSLTLQDIPIFQIDYIHQETIIRRSNQLDIMLQAKIENNSEDAKN